MKQNRGPKENKTEAAFAAHLRTHYPDAQIEREGITLLLANGLRYTPDYTVFHPDGRVVLWEVKGYMRDDAAAKIKMAAAKFPRLAFWLVSAKDRTLTGWNIERVMP